MGSSWRNHFTVNYPRRDIICFSSVYNLPIYLTQKILSSIFHQESVFPSYPFLLYVYYTPWARISVVLYSFVYLFVLLEPEFSLEVVE